MHKALNIDENKKLITQNESATVPKTFQFSELNKAQIFEHIYGILNIDKK